MAVKSLSQNSAFIDLYNKADAAGKAAAAGCVPEPMYIVAGDISGKPVPGAKVYKIDDGPCGFAWINVKPGNSAFAKFLVAQGLARKDSYAGGVCIWVSAYSQSMAKKEDYAYAMARVFNDAGIKAFPGSRMD